jgi:hypothetical protein
MPTKCTTPTADVPPAKPATPAEAEAAGRAVHEGTAAGARKKPPVYLEPLSEVQSRVADLLADVVAQGGSEEVVSGLVLTAANHQWHRRLAHIHKDHAKLEANVKSLAEPDAARWKSELATAWAVSHRFGERKSDAKSITESIRFSIIRELQGLFETFLHNGGPEELRLMRDALRDHYSGGFGDGLAIAEAFLLQAGCRRKYVAVPDHMVEQIEKYVDCLQEADVAATGHAWSDPMPDPWEGLGR